MFNKENSPKLNATEIEILKMREQGKKIRVIAEKLNMSDGSVQNSLNRIAARFGFDDLRGIAREEKFKELVYPLLHPRETIEESKLVAAEPKPPEIETI